MPVRHRLLAVLVAVLWGVNFLAIHASLEQFPPFFLVALRWLALAVPTLLFVPRPTVAWRWILLYGLGFGILQFTFLYAAMAAGMPAGLASLVLQCSAPFTVLLGALVTREQLTGRRVAGVLVAVAGLGIVGAARSSAAALWPFLLTVLGGLGWAVGNLAVRRARSTQPMRLTLWMSVVPPLPMLALSLVVEGPERIADSLRLSSLGTSRGVLAVLGLAYTCVLATALGTGLWAWLMARHPAGVVAPFSMLVPVTGLTSAWLVLGERPAPLEWVGGAVVVTGVLLSATTARTAATGTPVATGSTARTASVAAGPAAPSDGPTALQAAGAGRGTRPRPG